MSWRHLFVVLAISVAACLSPSTGSALEKVAARYTTERGEQQWLSGPPTCTITYWNTCTGWIWIWSGWSVSDRFGVQFDTCCPGGTAGQLTDAFVFFNTGSPSGYGFTGSVDVWNADANNCPVGPTLSSQPLLPATGWNTLTYVNPVDVPPSFLMTYTLSASATLPDPVAIGSDHPAAGPTGPAACGSCFPTTRANHAFYFGTVDSPICPASAAFDDGVCFAQLLWDVQLACPNPVTDSSWGAIKSLYR